jgi:hypothetical protein
LNHFRSQYEVLLSQPDAEGKQLTFDLAAATGDAAAIAGRASVHA